MYAASLKICEIASLLSIASHPSGTLTAAVLYEFMLSIYEQTNQGKRTRSRILKILNETDGLTRNELVERSHLTYEQVRRQTQNLHIAGAIESRMIDQERRYFIKRVNVNGSTAIFLHCSSSECQF
jgi:DNA-binding transcriptional ArsR family regulator